MVGYVQGNDMRQKRIKSRTDERNKVGNHTHLKLCVFALIPFKLESQDSLDPLSLGPGGRTNPGSF